MNYICLLLFHAWIAEPIQMKHLYGGTKIEILCRIKFFFFWENFILPAGQVSVARHSSTMLAKEFGNYQWLPLNSTFCYYTYSQTSNTTCCNKSGNFCTIVTGCPDVSDTPYMGAVVLYRVRQRRPPPQELDAIGVRPGRFVARPEKKSKT